MRKNILWLIAGLILSLCLNNCSSFATPPRFQGEAELSLENEPEIGGIAIIKIKALFHGDIPNTAISKGEIYCLIPDGLKFINDKNYKIERMQGDTPKEWFDSVTLYEGPMKKDEIKEILFKVRILDEKKYIIFGGITGAVRKRLEIDLGEPEPPEWKPEVPQRIKILSKQGTGVIGTRAKTGGEKAEEVLDLELPKEIPPPVRTEFKIRTKDKPYIEYWNSRFIPLRYLIYSEEESPKVEVNFFLPEGLELVNDAGYEITQEEGKTTVLVYSGPMRFKECKAFYLQVKPQKQELFYLKIQTRLTNLKNEELLKEDKLEINLSPMRY